MEFIFKIIFVLIALSLVVEGIGILFQLVLGGGIGILALVGAIWDKETPLTFKEGLIAGAIFAIGVLILLFIVSLMGILFHGLYSLLPTLNNLFNVLAILGTAISFIRLKFKFGIAFILAENVIFMIGIKILGAIM